MVKDWPNEIRDRVTTSTPHASVKVVGNPKNLPWFLPIGLHIRGIYFSGRTKQCSRCFNFGYIAKEKKKSIRI
uniref:Uncharacterized protein n=1 Tax=Lepeophtheirus salmonis TaxID=72036 RepID=A0A0K2UCY7_LEPSM